MTVLLGTPSQRVLGFCFGTILANGLRDFQDRVVGLPIFWLSLLQFCMAWTLRDSLIFAKLFLNRTRRWLWSLSVTPLRTSICRLCCSNVFNALRGWLGLCRSTTLWLKAMSAHIGWPNMELKSRTDWRFGILVHHRFIVFYSRVLWVVPEFVSSFVFVLFCLFVPFDKKKIVIISFYYGCYLQMP